MIYIGYFHSPIGIVEIKAKEHFITSVQFIEEIDEPSKESSFLIQTTILQLEEYFKGKRTSFTLPLENKGTPFQQEVWNEVENVSFGETKTYSEIANTIGRQKAVRAVGSAVGKNPILLLIPCHRIVGIHNPLSGYSGGIWRKKWLLEHEQTL